MLHNQGTFSLCVDRASGLPLAARHHMGDHMNDPMPSETRPPLLVLGMHRSGTSAVTRVLSLQGWRLPKTLIPAGPGNELGHWESAKVADLNDRLLDQVQRNWLDPKPMDIEAGVSETAFQSAGEVIAAEFGDCSGLILKDPRLSRLMPFWRTVFAKAGVAPSAVLAVRNPLEVANSLARRDGIGRDHALHLWLTYMLEAEFGSRGMARALVHYEDILNDWRAALTGVFATLAIRQDLTDAGMALDADSRHHRCSPDDVFEDSQVGADVKRLYGRLLQPGALADQAFFDAERRAWRDTWSGTSPGGGPSGFALARPETYMLRSRSLSAEGKWPEALEQARIAVERAPEDARAFHQMGVLLGRTGDVPAALTALRRALALDDTVPGVHFNLSHLLFRDGKQGEALEFALAAVARFPDNAHLHHHLGNIYGRTGRYAEAIAAHERALEIDNTVPAFGQALKSAQALQNKSGAAGAGAGSAVD